MSIRTKSITKIDKQRIQQSELKLIVQKAIDFNEADTKDTDIYPLLSETSEFISRLPENEKFLCEQACEFRSLLSNCVRCSFNYSAESSWKQLRSFCIKIE